MNVPMLSILIISYNTREMTLACVRSIFAQAEGDNFEVIVLDNASTDGSADALEGEFGERVHLIRSPVNLGFASGNNAAASHASGEYLLLLNPDTVVLGHAIDHLIEFAMEHPAAGIWGGRTVFADGSLNPASCWRRATVWSMACQASGLARVFRHWPLFNPEAFGGWKRDNVRKVDIVSGCFFLIRRDLWEALDGFDRDFFMYGEEADLCLRAQKRGAKPLVTPRATIVHHGGASEPVRAEKLVRLLAAKATLIHRHWPRWKVPIGLMLLQAWPLSRLLALTLATMARRGLDARTAWAHVWQRRGEWSQGYLSCDTPTSGQRT